MRKVRLWYGIEESELKLVVFPLLRFLKARALFSYYPSKTVLCIKAEKSRAGIGLLK